LAAARHFPVKKQAECECDIVIGWKGNSGSVEHAFWVEIALEKVLMIYPNVKLPKFFQSKCGNWRCFSGRLKRCHGVVN
jgi:hypothetical protein